MTTGVPTPLLPRPKRALAQYFDSIAATRDGWKRGNAYYYRELERLCAQVVPPGKAVLELGCGTGDLLAAVRPALGVGLDLSRAMLARAREKYPQIHFIHADAEALPLRPDRPFDYVICSDLLGHLDDIWLALRELGAICHPETRLIITYYNFLWQPALSLGERLGLKMPQRQQNWLGTQDVENLLVLCDFVVDAQGSRLLIPVLPAPIAPLSGVVTRLNDALANRAGLRHLAMVTFWEARPATQRRAVAPLSCSVVVPCRNEAGNIEACLERMPRMGSHTEVIFVDGASTDGTREKILECIERYRGRLDIKLIDQVPPERKSGPGAEGGEKVTMLSLGKGDGVRKGFAAASGDMLMILDADLTVPPEDLPKFYLPIAEGKADFVNGTRLVYPLEDEAMHSINFLGNKLFGLLFTWLLEQRIKDTLCGTKVIRKRDYERLAQDRAYFGDFDPFGDFDLLFGAARLGLRIAEVPVRYRRRTSGHSKVRVLKHGWLLVRMSVIGFRRLKLAKWRRRIVELLLRPAPGEKGRA